MKQEHDLWEEWLKKAAAGLQGHPDYDRVRRELLDHLEDKAADLTRVFPDISPEEVQVRALAGMGEAESLSRALAQAHSQVLGTLYGLSGLLLGITVPLVALEGIFMLWRWIVPLAVQDWPF